MAGGGGRALVTVYRRLSALVSAPTVDLARLTATVSAELGVAAVVVTAELRVLAASQPDGSEGPRQPDPDERIWARALPTAAATGRAVRLPGAGTTAHVVAPVLVADEAHSFLVTSEDTAQRARRARPDAPAGDDVLLLVTEHAATVASVLAARERVLAAAAGQVRADLVGGLLLDRARDADQAAQWAEHVGYDADAAHRVVLVAPVEQDAAHPAGMLGEAEEHLRRAAPGALTLVRDSEVVAVVALDADPDAAGTDCARKLARGAATWPVTVAVGGVTASPAGLATSYDQARRTLLAARRLGRAGHLLRFDDLGIHRLLLQIPDPEAARAFAREVLGRLATDDSERTVELLRTLARYFREDGSPQRVARALSVHPNTVGYRLRRAEELSGLSLERYRDRLAAQVALEILGEMAR